MKISIIGTWYVGLIQTVWLAKIWFKVTALDIFEEKINMLKMWIPTIYENWLEDLLKETLPNINFTTDINELSGSDIIFLCVWTPQDDDGKTDLTYIKQAAKSLENVLAWNEIIVIKSTVPVGTNKMIYELLWKKYSIVSNPEFLREWLAIEDFFNPDRVVLWFNENTTEETKNKINTVYSFFSNKWIPIIDCNWQTAELIKYAANSFLATKITFINEIARLSDQLWANIKDISTAIWLDSRIGSKFLNAGIGYGGSCFPKDVKSLIHQFRENGLTGEIITKVDETNNTQVEYFLEKIIAKYWNSLSWKHIWILWVAFKPDTDDLRESRSLVLINKLLKLGAILKVYDYNNKALENFEKYCYSLNTGIRNFIPITISKNFEDMARNIDILIIAIEDKRVLTEDFSKINLKDNIIFDGKNILDKKTIEELGIHYVGVGC